MKITPIRTRPLLPPRDDLLSVLAEQYEHIRAGSVVAISSKVVAIGEGRTVPIPAFGDPGALKDALAKGEADECTPIVLIEDIPHIAFALEEPSDPHLKLSVPMEEDLFRRFFSREAWQRGGAGKE